MLRSCWTNLRIPALVNCEKNDRVRCLLSGAFDWCGFFPLRVNKKKYQSLLFKSALHSALLTFSWENSSQCCFKGGKKFFAASTMHLRTYLENRAVGKSENPGGSSKVVGIICPPGWDRVNWSAKIWGYHGKPPALTALQKAVAARCFWR